MQAGPDSKMQKRRSWQSGLPLAGVCIGVLLIIGPFMAGLVRSLLIWVGDEPQFSLANFYWLFTDRRIHQAALNSLICGIGAMVISLVLGTSLAWIVSRTNVPGREIFKTLNLVPFFFSPYVGAIGWIFLVAPYSGLMQTTISSFTGEPVEGPNIYSLGGVIWILSLFYTPYVYLFVISPLQRMDAAFEDAARVHGASFWTTIRLVTLPLIQPGLLSAALIVFVTSAGLFDVPLALTATKGIRTMPTEVFALVRYPSDLGKAAAFGIFVTFVTVTLTLLQRHHLSKRRYDIVSGKGYKPRVIELKGGAKFLALSVEIIFLLTSVVLPVIALILVALSPIWTGRFNPSTVTLSNFSYVLFDYSLTRQAILNSLFLAVTGATLGVILSGMQSYYLLRVRSAFKSFADALLSLPLGIPGIVLSLFFLVLAIRSPLYGTLAILLIAYIARFFPFSTRTVSAMLSAIHPELEESARANGASWAQTMRHILLPLLRPALIAAWIMLFIIFIRELGASILLYASGTETISIAMLLLSENSVGYVAALALVQLFLLLSGFMLFRLTKVSAIQ
jgi:iron(III) transport system permease protein